MIKNLIVAITLIYSNVVFSKTLVFSDIDDTIKKAYTLGGAEGLKVFFKKVPFYEMISIFQEIEKFESSNQGVAFYYVSAAPNFSFKGDKWIRKHKFPEGPVILKTHNNHGPTFDYKYGNIKSIILNAQKKHKDIKVLFFGDNSQYDADVYYKLRKDLNLDAEIFIRDVSTFASDVSPYLPVKRLDGVNYFFSERNLIEFNYFNFLSNKTRDFVINNYNNKSIIPYYVEKTLAERFESICNKDALYDSETWRGYCKELGKSQSRDYMDEYYALY